MKTKIVLLLVIVLVNASCVNWVSFFIQNTTDHEIHYYKTVVYDVQKDSFFERILLRDHPNAKYEQGKITIEYSKVLDKDSMYYLNMFSYKEKSKIKTVDSSHFFRINSFIITSDSDTILFTSKEIIEKVNKLLMERRLNTSVKIPRNERNHLIWELNDSDLLKKEP